MPISLEFRRTSMPVEIIDMIEETHIQLVRGERQRRP
jgi:hypothetical protein